MDLFPTRSAKMAGLGRLIMPTGLTMMLLAAACSSGPSEQIATDPVSDGPAEAAVDVVGDAEVVVDVAGVEAGDADVAGVEAAAGTASDTFDEDFLLRHGGSRFVPLDEPVLINAADATWLDPDDIVMGIVAPDGEAQAYPVDQMAYHHIANTRLAGEPFVVTY